jgi:flavin-dependent dehydrogenase
VCAARLALRGRRVVVVERERHPRFHLGESLLPNSVGVLDAIGALGEVKARFLPKHGARFVDAQDAGRAARYAFAEAFHARYTHAFEVPRDEFDALLYRHAGACGAELREGWEALGVVFDGPRATGIRAKDPTGATHTLRAPIVVDASGRDALMARSTRDVHPIAQLDHTALYTQVRGAWRDTGDREGDIQIVVLEMRADAGFRLGPLSDERADPDLPVRGWFWFIPFADGRTSVGAVLPNAWIRRALSAARPKGADSNAPRERSAEGPEGLFRAALDAAPTAAGMLADATYLFPPRATADYSFRVERIRGEGWLALGDAAGFIDPLFSTGAHLAMCGALAAADAIDEGLAAGDLSGGRFERWEAQMRAGAELFIGAVQAFYAGELASYLFADPQHPFLRRAITSLLAGDVFDEQALWARDMRARFPVRPATQTSF